MTRRTLAVAGLLVLVAAPFAGAQESGFQRAEWVDPAPTSQVDGQPLAYLDSARQLTGIVTHENGIERVTALLVPAQDPPPEECRATVDPNATMERNGSTFRVTATFPCNLVYEVRANAQSRAGSGLGAPPPATHVMPLLVAVAIPPAPVASVDAVVDGDARTVTLEWPGGPEPDLLGYVVSRDGEAIGQVNASEATRFIDDEPPGGSVAYEVTAVRSGPDDEVQQVASEPTTVAVETPADPDAPATSTGGSDPSAGPVDPQLAGEATQAEVQGQPNGAGLSSVAARGQRPPSLGPPTTVDTGFSETLPFDPNAPSQRASGDPAVVATFEEVVALDEKQRLAFIAGGLAVLVGAATIFYVTRRAAREAY